MQLCGATPFANAKLKVIGNLSLGGTLTVSLVNGFVPAFANSFDLLDWVALSGKFASIQLPSLTSGLAWNTSLLYVDGVLKVTDTNHLPGDFNRDGQLTAADLPAMLIALTDLKAYKSTNALTDPQLVAIGDLDGDGQVTNRDIQSQVGLLTSHAGGGSTTAVPEPASVLLLLSGALAFLLKRRFPACLPAHPRMRER